MKHFIIKQKFVGKKDKKVNRFYASDAAFESDINRMYTAGAVYISALHNVKDYCSVIIDDRVYIFSIYDTVKDVRETIAHALNINIKNVKIRSIFEFKDNAPLYDVYECSIVVNLGYKSFEEIIKFDFRDNTNE